MTAPLTRTLASDTPACTALVDATTIVGAAPFAGTVTSVTYAPEADITGAASPASRTLSLVNKGADGNGTTVVATLALVGGITLSDFAARTIPVSVTPANVAVAEGDVLAWTSVHVGATGLADPGGSASVGVSRSAGG